MAHINLLPWREEALQAQQKLYFTILTAIGLVTLALVLAINFYYQARIDGQNSKNQYLKNEIAVLDVQIAEIKTLNSKKDALEKRINVVEQLQRSRNVGTQVLDEIANIIPNGIYIIELEKQGNTLQLTGKSESNNHLANMIRAVELSDLFVDATPESITADDDSSKLLSSFKMKVKIKGLVDETDQGGEK
jgi:type IV pilus assembly protein PilN